MTPRIAPVAYLLLAFAAGAARAATLMTVNTTSDAIDAAGDCSLREAITSVNGSTVVDGCTDPTVGGTPYTIRFSIAGPGPHSFVVGSQLPSISKPLTIDATPAGNCAGADFQIVLSGGGTGSYLGLRFIAGSAGSVVRGLVMNSFTGAIRLDSGNNKIFCNRLGTDAAGLAAVANRDGVIIFEASDNVVGTDGNGTDDAAEGNVISGNERYGIFARSSFFTDPSSTLNTVIAGNLIGLGADGNVALGNGDIGIELRNTEGTRIGTDGNGTSDALEGNVISANGTAPGSEGLGIRHDFFDLPGDPANLTVIAGNRIGTDATGLLARGNGFAGTARVGGMLIERGANGTRIGTNGDGVSDDLERNLIAANVPQGIVLAADHAKVAGNWIGVDATGNAPLGNQVGVAILPGSGDFNIVGTDGDGVGDDVEGNLISGNTQWGVMVDGRGTTVVALGNEIAGNVFGLGADGVTDVGQPGGVLLTGRTDGTIVGSDGDGTSDDLEVNRFAYNGDGLRDTVAAAFANSARCNVFGLDAAGDPAPNDFGVRLASSGLSLRDNFVHYSSQDGVLVTGGALSSAGDNAVSCNAAGLDNTSGVNLVIPDVWWGAADGPSGAGPGNGDSISTLVDATGFLGAATTACGITAVSYPCFPVDLSITKVGSPPSVAWGGTLTYTVTVTNNSLSNATGVAVTDVLPAEVSGGTTTGCLNDPAGVPTCQLGTVAAGTSVQYSVAVTVNLGAGSIVNTASVAGTEVDPNPANDSATATNAGLGSVIQIPTLADVGLAVLATLLAVLGLLALRGTGPR